MDYEDMSHGEPVIGLHYAGPQEYDKAAGELRYATDIAFPDMAQVVAFRSTIPHGRLLGLDVEQARRAPGVLAVLTAADVPGKKDFGYIYKDTPLLAYDKTHCIGEPIALVVADTREQATDACRMIRWEYQELPGVFTVEQALEDTLPAIHNDTNLLRRNVLRKGVVTDVDAYRVRGSFSTQRVAHMYMEPECSVALYEDGKLTVYTASQDIFSDRTQICESLLLPPENVRVIQSPTGGGFGGKLDITTELMAALAAYRTHRPVKAVLDRSESMHIAPKRHPIRFELELSADANGRLSALKGKAYSDTGAFASSGDKVLRKSLTNITGPYFVPNIYIEGYTVYTNNPQAGAMRGFGQCQSSFAFEALLDMLAAEMGVDGNKLRRDNLLRPGDTNGVGNVIPESMRVDSTWNALQEYIAAHPFEHPEDGRAYGVGFANSMFATGLGFGRPDQALVKLRLHEDGCFTLYSGAADIGQGALSTFIMIGAQALGVAGDRVRVVNADTETTPPCGPTTATRLTVMVGNAVLRAAQAMRQALSAAMAAYTGEESLHVELRKECLVAGSCKVAYPELVRYCAEQSIPLESEGFYDSTSKPEDPETLQGPVFNCYVWGSQAVEVAVDRGTGEIEVLRAIAAFDVGKAIDHKRVRGQIEGGVSMALGMALTEDMQGCSGRVRADSFSTYLIPAAEDLPDIESIVVETAFEDGPYGAKGIGEPPTQGAAAACANAVYDAIGVRINQLPISPESVLAAIRAGK